MHKRIFATVLTAAAFALPAFAGAATEIVTGNTSAGENQPGWMFARNINNATPFEFNTNAFEIGEGSLYVEPISGIIAAKKFIAENFINTPVANVNLISYDFKIGAEGLDTQEEHFYMNVYANFGVSNDLKFFDCRYNIVPTEGSKAEFKTVTFDPTQSYDVATRVGESASPFTCPAIPADMDTLSPGSNIRAIAINVGDTSANDAGLDGYLDNVVVNLDSGITIYDFEPASGDADGDGVLNENDLCDATESSSDQGGWTGGWGTNRWEIRGTEELTWFQNQPVKKGKGTSPVSTALGIDYTYGCDGGQILELLEEEFGGVFGGHHKFGLSGGLVKAFHEDMADAVVDGPYLIDTVTVNSKLIGGANSIVGLDTTKQYKLKASGTWTNRPGEVVDAEYSSINGGGWTDAPDGGYLPPLIDLQVGMMPTEWGVYSPTHIYEIASYTPVVNGVLNFRIFDGDVNSNTPDAGWYGDNNGSLTVEIYAIN